MRIFGQEIGEFELRAAGLGLLVPAAVMLLALAIAARLRRSFAVGPSHDRRLLLQAMFGALGLAATVILAYFALDLGPLRPKAGSQWLPYLPLLAVPVGLIVARPQPWWLVTAILAITGAMVGPLLLADWWSMAALWSVALGYALLFSVGAMISTSWSAPRLALALVATTAVAGFVLKQAAMARLMQIGGILFAACVAAAIAAVLFGRDPEARAIRAMVPGALLLVISLMFSAYLGSFSDVPGACYAAVALAPFGLALRHVPVVRSRRPFMRDLASVTGMMFPLVFATVRAALA